MVLEEHECTAFCYSQRRSLKYTVMAFSLCDLGITKFYRIKVKKEIRLFDPQLTCWHTIDGNK